MREKDLKKLFGQRVQQLRRLKGLTQEDLAAKVDRSVDTISNIERGFSSTRIETAAQLAKTLGITLSEMFDFNPNGDVAKGHRREVERLIHLIYQCPKNRVTALTKIIEQAIHLTADHTK